MCWHDGAASEAVSLDEWSRRWSRRQSITISTIFQPRTRKDYGRWRPCSIPYLGTGVALGRETNVLIKQGLRVSFGGRCVDRGTTGGDQTRVKELDRSCIAGRIAQYWQRGAACHSQWVVASSNAKDMPRERKPSNTAAQHVENAKVIQEMQHSSGSQSNG